MNANTLFPLATIALLAAGIARSALSAPDPELTYGDIRYRPTAASCDVRVKIVDSAGFEVFSAKESTRPVLPRS